MLHCLIYQKSYAKFDFNETVGDNKLQVMLNIVNGTNVKVTGKIYGAKVSTFRGGMANNLPKPPKTMTVIYGHNSTRTSNRKIILGYRQPGDMLIDTIVKNLTITNHFAETEFQYEKATHFFTAVEFTFAVRQYMSLNFNLMIEFTELDVFFVYSLQRQLHFLTVHFWANKKLMSSFTI